jgi:Aspartyl protease
MQNLLADHQYGRVAAQLGQLPADQAQFYRGLLANRSNKIAQSIELLEPLVNQVAASGDAAREWLIRKALAEDYLRQGDWAKAAMAYQTLDARLHAKLSPDELDEIEMPLKLLQLAKDNPPMNVEPCEPFPMRASVDSLGLLDIPVYVDARQRNWMLDPTLPFNLIAQSTAREVGLKVSDEAATIHTLTGRNIQVRAAVVPRFTIGGRLTIHDMTAFVYNDSDYYFPMTGYQVEGVLGYPALAAMGSITVTDNIIQVQPAKQIQAATPADLLTAGAPFYLDGDQIIISLGKPGGAEFFAPPDASGAAHSTDEYYDRMFAIDAGSELTYLTARYFDEHAAEFNNAKGEMYTFPLHYSPPQPTYIAETVPLVAGNTAVDFHFIRVLTQPLGTAALDDVYGVLGIDALDQLKSYTFDYRTMRFAAQVE